MSSKEILITEQPLPAITFDPLFIDKLRNVRNYDIRQGNALLEGLTDGIIPNTYIIADRDRHVQVANSNMTTPYPLYIVQEESGCCARCWCPGMQSFVGRVHHADAYVAAGGTCCGCYSGHRFKSNPNAGVAFTVEREGQCCGKCLGCFVCCECCQNDMTMHAGNANVRPGMPPAQSGGYFARALVPIGGGGFVPTINLFTSGSEEPFAVVKGPTCYAGCIGVLTDTVFYVFSTKHGATSSTKRDPGYIGTIVKPKPATCGECCREMCTSADHYLFEAGPGFDELTPEQRAALIGVIIQIDYTFFENDLPPVYVARGGGNSTVIICTLCQVYCFGCCCPVQICIPLGGNNN